MTWCYSYYEPLSCANKLVQVGKSKINSRAIPFAAVRMYVSLGGASAEMCYFLFGELMTLVFHKSVILRLKAHWGRVYLFVSCLYSTWPRKVRVPCCSS